MGFRGLVSGPGLTAKAVTIEDSGLWRLGFRSLLSDLVTVA